MPLKKSFWIALSISVVFLIAWEYYWRSSGYLPSIDMNKDLWAVQRAKVDKLGKNDVILTGSSRVLFDIQLDKWEENTGIRPVQLSSVGSSPLPIFHDLVNNTEFNGTIVVGVTPGLFFSTTFPQADPWSRAQGKVDHYYDRTYADRLNHWLSIPLQKNLVFISAEEESSDDDKDLKSLLKRIKIGNRTKPGPPPFYDFGSVSPDYNVRMSHRTATDTAFANTVKAFWKWVVMESGAPPPDKEGTSAFFLEDAKKFIARGGNLILLRCPSTGLFLEGERQFFAREEGFDMLVDSSGAYGYHFEDYESLSGFDCPEWSHLSGPDADIFTEELVKILIEDKVITNQKND